MEEMHNDAQARLSESVVRFNHAVAGARRDATPTDVACLRRDIPAADRSARTSG